jgi:L-seryl-tRNA(Ser) seleniumtransferase
MSGRNRLRELPSVDRLATSVARAELDARRAELLDGATDEVDLVARARERLRPSLRRVLNATGVIVHTNLGRAPLAEQAQAAVARIAAGYSNLELDLASGERGSRHDHVEGLLQELTGAPAAIAVNNCAAAVLLAVGARPRGRETGG